MIFVVLTRWSKSVAPRQGELLQVCALQRKQGHHGGSEPTGPSAQGQAINPALRWDQGPPCHHIAACYCFQGDS